MSGASGSINSTQAIYGSIGQYFSPSNLATFQAWANSPVIPAANLIGGHVDDQKCYIHSNCAETNLDMQYIMTMSPYSPTTYWYSDNWFTGFLSEVANTVKPPKVISMSYASQETNMVASVYMAFDNEAIKLGIQGTTVLAASGDGGVSPLSAGADRNLCGYVPVFPATSPYIISVGGTIVSL